MDGKIIENDLMKNISELEMYRDEEAKCFTGIEDCIKDASKCYKSDNSSSISALCNDVASVGKMLCSNRNKYIDTFKYVLELYINQAETTKANFSNGGDQI